MKRKFQQWLFRQTWSYVKRQSEDVGIFLQKRWKHGLPTELHVLVTDIRAALKWVLYHGRPVT